MRQTEIARMRLENEAARLAHETARLKRATQILQKYDTLESNRARRQPVNEYQEEGGIYDMSKRLKGCNLGRDLERNYSPAKAMLHQFRVNVVGCEGKLTLNLPDEKGKEAGDFFNQVWSKDCDYRDDCDWSTLLQNALISEIREGDMLAVVDDAITEDDSGRLLTWEADQIVPLDESTLLQSPYKAGYTQDNGLIRSKWGRVVAYVTTGKRGLTNISNIEDATFWRRGEQARLCKNPWRLNQGRGVPSLLTPAGNLIDLYEMLASELMSAKRAAKQYAFVKREDAVTDWDTPAGVSNGLPENDGKEATAVAEDAASQTTQSAARNYERLEAFTGGLTDYLDSGDVVEFPKLDHPNSALAAFLETVHGYSGAALGLAKVYTTLQASTSFTAYRGEQIITWQTFYWLQKHMERAICDWVAVKVLRWAQRKNLVAPLPAGWERALSWSWPEMPEVNVVDAENATAAALKNGTTDYSILLGPDWKKRLTNLAEQTNFIREQNLPLKQLETVSGGQLEADSNKKDEEAKREVEK